MAYEGSITIADLMDGAPGADGSSVSKATILYYLDTKAVVPVSPQSQSSPWSEDRDVQDQWTKKIPTYVSGATYYVCLESEITNNVGVCTYVYGDAVEDNGLTDAATNSSEAITISRATQQHFWFVSEKTGTIDAGAYITDTPIDTFKQGKSGGYLYASSTGLTLGKDNNTLMALSGSELDFYRPGTSTIDAKLNSSGLTLTKGGIKAGTVNSSGFVYLSTDNYGSNVTINNHQASNWKQIIGTKFGVDADGNLYASGANIQGQVTITAGSNIYTKDEVDDAVENATAELISAKEASGSIVHIEDASEYPALDCKVSLNPIQDLHGYDKPWAGGNGKNLLPMTVDNIKALNGGISAWSGNTRVMSGVTVTIQTDADNNVVGVLFDGTATSSVFVHLALFSVGALNGEKILSGCPANGASSTYNITMFDGSNVFRDLGNGASFNGNVFTASTQAFIRIQSGYSCNNMLFKPMIRLASETDASFEPYSNICPISGWNEVNVQRTGINMLENGFSGSHTTNGVTFTMLSDGRLSLSGTATATMIPITNIQKGVTTMSAQNDETKHLPNGTYTVKPTGVNGIMWQVSASNTSGNTKLASLFDRASGSFTVNDTYKYNWARLFIAKGTNCDGVILEPMFVLGNTAPTDYEPYQGNTYTINLDGTRYGGTLDVTSGVLKVCPYYASYNGETLTGEWISDRDEYSPNTSPTIGAQVVNIGGSLSTVQLTPTEVSLLLGTNNIWADSGDTYLKYATMNSDMLSLMDKSNADLSRAKSEIDAKKSVHTIDSTYKPNYSTALNWAKTSQTYSNNGIDTTGVKVGDTVRLGVLVNDFTGNPTVYVVGTVTAIGSESSFTMMGKGLDTTIIDGGNILTNSIGANQIKANVIDTSKLTIGAQDEMLNSKIEVGGRNLVWDTEWKNISTRWSNWGSPTTREIVTANGKRWLHLVTTASAYQGYSQAQDKRNGYGEIKAGDKVVISYSAYAKTAGQICTVGCHWRNSSGTIVAQNWFPSTLTTTEKRYTSPVFTIPNNAVGFNVMIGDGTANAQELWISQVKIEFGTKATDWTPAPEDLAATATSYITDIGNDGIRIHPASTENNSVLINSDGMTVYKGGTADTNSVAFYGDTARIGKKASRHVEVKTGGMQVYNGEGDSNMVTHIGYESVQGETGTTMGVFFTFGKRKSNQTKGEYSVAEGNGTTASSYCSHAEGNGTTASYLASHAEGYGTTASGSCSHAEGNGTTASYWASHAEGNGTTASGSCSHAEGNGTTASYLASHAEGYGTTAGGYSSHAEGGYTTASGSYSHAGGRGTIAGQKSQTAIGEYNVTDASGEANKRGKYVLIVGNGTSNDARSNALTVAWDGNVKLAIDSSATGSSTVDGKIMDSLRSLGWDASTEGVIV